MFINPRNGHFFHKKLNAIHLFIYWHHQQLQYTVHQNNKIYEIILFSICFQHFMLSENTGMLIIKT